MLKPDRFSCSQKIRLKQDPPVYQYLLQNELPSSKLTHKEIRGIIRKICTVRFLIVRIYPEKETAVLVIPEMCADKIITLYHRSLICRSSRSN